jgi:apolipoprotein N-acyltransferase
MRALETGRPMLRATTNGISALIDYRGHLLKTSQQFQTDVSSGVVQPHSGSTPYIDFGNLPVLALLLLSLLLTGRPWHRQR